MVKITCKKVDGTKSDIFVDFFKFPDGQPHINLTDTLKGANLSSATIHMRICGPEDFFRAIVLKSALQKYAASVYLTAPWIFGLRTDRRFSDGEPDTGNIVLRGIYNNFTGLTTYCPHNLEAFKSAREYVFNYDDLVETTFFSRAIEQFQPDTLILPDEGAEKRFKIQKILSISDCKTPEVVVCQKVRELSTGKITHFKVIKGEPRGRCLILDDICDGGATFKLVSEAVRVDSVGLAVFHGIFSKGLVEGIDQYYTTNSYQPAENIFKLLGDKVSVRRVFDDC